MGHDRYQDAVTQAQRIKRRREELGLTQEKLARQLEVSKNTVARWEAGSDIKGANLVALATALDVAPEWITGGDGSQRDGEREVPDPPHWLEFVENYPDIAVLSPEDLADIKRALARGGRRVRAWTDYIPIANALRDLHPSPTFQAKKNASRR